jgi:predicted nucleotidyltransferase
VDDNILDEIVRRILRVCQPQCVILFGSAATGQMTPDSDVDLLVVLRGDPDARAEAVSIRRALSGLPYPFDVIVMSHERFIETRDVIGGIAWPATRHGKAIYEAAIADERVPLRPPPSPHTL